MKSEQEKSEGAQPQEEIVAAWVYRLNGISRNPPLTRSFPQLSEIVREIWLAGAACVSPPDQKLRNALNRLMVHFFGDDPECPECGKELGEGNCDTCYVGREAMAALELPSPPASATGKEQ